MSVLTGGWTHQDLTDADRVAVYENVAELPEKLDDSPLARLLS